MVTRRKAPSKRSVRRSRAAKRFEDLTVKDIVNQRVQSARPDLTGEKVASLLAEGRGAVPVIDRSKQLLGVVSEHDVPVAPMKGRRGALERSRSDERESLFSAPGDQFADAGACVDGKRPPSVPVVNERQNRLLGMVTRRDVVRAALRPAAKRRSTAVIGFFVRS